MRPRSGWHNIMTNLKKTGHGLVSSVLKKGPKACFYEHNTEPSALIKDGEPLDHPGFWKTSAPRNCVLLFYTYGPVILHFIITIQILLLHGHAWEVSHWFLTLEPGKPCGICGGQSGNEANLSQHTSFSLPANYHSTNARYLYIITVTSRADTGSASQASNTIQLSLITLPYYTATWNIWEFSIIHAPLSFLFHCIHYSMPLNVKE